jgi:hypothetical protein
MLQKIKCQEKWPMKRTEEKQNNRTLIDGVIAGIGNRIGQKRDSIFINETKNEILDIGYTINIPRIHVSRVDYEVISDVMRQLADIIPEFLAGHTLLIQQKPPSETHYLHFVKKVSGLHGDYVHLFKLDFRFSSDMGTNYHDGTADFYPSYSTERIPYKSLLIPVDTIKYENDRIVDFSTIKILHGESVDGDKHFMTHTIFDEFDPTAVNEKIHDEAGRGLFPFSLRIYPFVSYGYFSVCMNIPDPAGNVIDEAVRIFEPIAYKVIASFDPTHLARKPAGDYEEITIDESGLIQYAPVFSDRAKDFFSRYKIYQDDALALKRWRRLDIEQQ